ncbi:MAG: TIGR00645 family protein [Beijerinckiaceae bacterium]
MATKHPSGDSLAERWLEKFLFASRWILAPFYVALVVALCIVLLKAIQELAHFVARAWVATESEVILAVLALIDLTLTGSLILIVIFSGYENFVSKIRHTDHEDWPEWMGSIDFSGLKLKLLSSIVAISAIQVLKAFMSLKTTSDRDLMWYVGIHLMFVVSGLFMAWTDKLSGEGHAKPKKAAKAEHETGGAT